MTRKRLTCAVRISHLHYTVNLIPASSSHHCHISSLQAESVPRPLGALREGKPFNSFTPPGAKERELRREGRDKQEGRKEGRVGSGKGGKKG